MMNDDMHKGVVLRFRWQSLKEFVAERTCQLVPQWDSSLNVSGNFI